MKPLGPVPAVDASEVSVVSRSERWLLSPIAPQEQGELEKPSGVIGAGGHRLHLLMALSNQGQHQAPAAGVSAGQDSGTKEQSMFNNHQRLAPMTVTGALPWSGVPAHLLHHPTLASAPHVPRSAPCCRCVGGQRKS